MPIFKKIPKFTQPTHRVRSNWGTVDESDAAAFQKRLDGLVNSLGLLGIQLSLKTPDQKRWNGASGTVDPSRRHHLETDHLMRIGSVTKLFTSVVILRLVEEGAIALTAPLSKWLPAFPRASRITLRMLLNHTSGIDNPPFTTRVKLKLLFSKEPFDLDELCALAADTPPHDEPGRTYRYSNANHHLLGVIAQKVTGKPISTLYTEGIFSKLGLTQTALMPVQPPPSNLITGFDNVYTPSLRMLRVRPDNAMIASHGNTSGGMVSTAEELVTFIDGLFFPKLVSRDLVDRMREISPCSEPAFHYTGHGAGVFRFDIGGADYLGHFGQFVGFQAIALYHPERHTAIAAIGNLSESRIFDVIQRFGDVVG